MVKQHTRKRKSQSVHDKRKGGFKDDEDLDAVEIVAELWIDLIRHGLAKCRNLISSRLNEARSSQTNQRTSQTDAVPVDQAPGRLSQNCHKEVPQPLHWTTDGRNVDGLVFMAFMDW